MERWNDRLIDWRRSNGHPEGLDSVDALEPGRCPRQQAIASVGHYA